MLRKLIAIIIIVCFPLISRASIIFEDDFDDCSSGCTVGYTAPNSPSVGSWYEWHVVGGLSDTCNSETKYFGEIITPGRGGSGKALNTWRCSNTSPTHDDFTGVLHYLFGGSYTAVYVRYYMLMPTALTATTSDACYVKHWRFNTSGGSGEMYLNFNGCGDLRSNGALQYYDGGGWTTILNNTELQAIWDGNWHAMQWFFDLSNSDLILWVDGVQKYSNLSFSYNASGNFTGIQHLGIGNYSSSSTWQTTWQAMKIDDLVIATTKAETDPDDADITAPATAIGMDSPQITSIGKTITGTATDAVGVTSCKYRLGSAPDATYGTACTGTTEWSCAVDSGDLSDGDNTVYVGCTDAAANWGSGDSITVRKLSTSLLSESFENNSFSARGWFDNSQDTTTSGGQSGNCLEWTWSSSSSTPTDGGAMRHEFTAADEILIDFYVNFGSTWRGSQQSYHPHLFYIMSDLDDEWGSLAQNYLQTYIEFISDIGSPYEVRPSIGFQDMLRVNYGLGTPPVDIESTTENRSTFYCNQTAYGSPTTNACYDAGTNDWYSASIWTDTLHEVTKAQWAHVQIQLAMNSIYGSVGQADGIMREWVDDVLVIDKTNMMLRTNQYATQKWDTMVLAPYIGDGSPIAQTMYIDELKLTALTGGDTTSPACTISTGDPQAVSSDSVTLQGTCTDAVGVTAVKARLSSAPDASNGTSCTCDDGTCNGTSEAFTCVFSGLSEGANTVYVGGGDAAANWSTGGDADSITVNYTLAGVVHTVGAGTVHTIPAGTENVCGAP